MNKHMPKLRQKVALKALALANGAAQPNPLLHNIATTHQDCTMIEPAPRNEL
jgi:hypothetical protein